MDAQNNIINTLPEESDNSMHSLDKTTDDSSIVADHFKILLWPILVAGLFQIVALHNQNTTLLLCITNAILILIVLIQSIKRYKKWQIVALIGGGTGAVSIFIVALYKLIFSFQIIYIFNLFVQPAIIGVIDGIAAGFIFIIVRLFLKK